MLFGVVGCLTSCASDEPQKPVEDAELPAIEEGKYLPEFATILSKAVFFSTDLRKFLKEEALKQFDCDYDILYQAVKDEMVGNESFRDILLFFSDEKTLSEIERNNPMLTIRIPSIFMFNVHPSTIDVLDNELPVALSYENGSRLYMNGEVVDTIKKGDIPGFNLLVVTQNTRVESVVASRNGSSAYCFQESLLRWEQNTLRAAHALLLLMLLFRGQRL